MAGCGQKLQQQQMLTWGVNRGAINVSTANIGPHEACSDVRYIHSNCYLATSAFLHLKKTVRGAGRALRGRSAALARQEAWALLLVHNMIAALAAEAAVTAGTSLAAVSFTAVPSLPRERVAADTCCRHCGQRPTSGGDPGARLTTAVAAQPLNRQDRKRTSGRTTTERGKWPTEEADYDLTIVPSNLPKADTSPRTYGQWPPA
jgi:hypothetical protein